jgi:hypothetical protein
MEITNLSGTFSIFEFEPASPETNHVTHYQGYFYYADVIRNIFSIGLFGNSEPQPN